MYIKCDGYNKKKNSLHIPDLHKKRRSMSEEKKKNLNKINFKFKHNDDAYLKALSEISYSLSHKQHDVDSLESGLKSMLSELCELGLSGTLFRRIAK